jgi:hypothetical protein
MCLYLLNHILIKLTDIHEKIGTSNYYKHIRHTVQFPTLINAAQWSGEFLGWGR